MAVEVFCLLKIAQHIKVIVMSILQDDDHSFLEYVQPLLMLQPKGA